MKFETLLARRYIFSQKRHSLLTVCSITIAVSLMVILFTSFTTMLGIERDILFDQAPYHVLFENVTKEQAAEIRHMLQVESVELKENPGGGNSYQAQVLFNTYIDSEETFLENMISHLKLNAEVLPMGGYRGLYVNTALMSFDQINLRGKYQTACYFSAFFIFVIFFALSLRLVIDTAFEVSSKERERQFGVLQSVGATPKQIVRILTAEGMILSGIGVPLGIGSGLLLTFAAYKAILSTGVAEAVLAQDKIGKIVHLHINPWMTAAAGLVGLAWVFFSAYGTGMRIIKMSPVQAITSRAKAVKKVRKHTLLSLFFGWKGKLASRNARRNRKRFVITVLSLTLSLTLFATISSILNLAQKGTEQMFLGIDEFGTFMPDFTLTIDMAPDQPVQSPTAFAEGIKMLEDTGYFTNFDHKISMRGEIRSDADSESRNIHIYYVNRNTYRRIFGEKPDISYDELTASGGAIARGTRYSVFPEQTEQEVSIQKYQEITREEYEKRYAAGLEQVQKENPERIREGQLCLSAQYAGNAHCIPSPENQNAYYEKHQIDGGYFYEILDETVTYRILKSVDRYTDEDYARFEAYDSVNELEQEPVQLILTEDKWLSGDWKKFGIHEKWCASLITCNLVKDEDYPAARQFLLDHKDMFGYNTENDEELYDAVDSYAVQKKVRTILSAIHIGLMFVLILIALIAIVNMVNIVSTGILNRKSELAAMQCVGMTRSQMYRLVIIECLQFTLWAAVAATLLCLLLFFGTLYMMEFIETIENRKQFLLALSEPIIKVWAASIFAFFCALAASLIPLRGMQKQPLVEQIRTVE